MAIDISSTRPNSLCAALVFTFRDYNGEVYLLVFLAVQSYVALFPYPILSILSQCTATDSGRWASRPCLVCGSHLHSVRPCWPLRFGSMCTVLHLAIYPHPTHTQTSHSLSLIPSLCAPLRGWGLGTRLRPNLPLVSFSVMDSWVGAGKEAIYYSWARGT